MSIHLFFFVKGNISHKLQYTTYNFKIWIKGVLYTVPDFFTLLSDYNIKELKLAIIVKMTHSKLYNRPFHSCVFAWPLKETLVW